MVGFFKGGARLGWSGAPLLISQALTGRAIWPPDVECRDRIRPNRALKLGAGTKFQLDENSSDDKQAGNGIATAHCAQRFSREISGLRLVFMHVDGFGGRVAASRGGVDDTVGERRDAKPCAARVPASATGSERLDESQRPLGCKIRR